MLRQRRTGQRRTSLGVDRSCDRVQRRQRDRSTARGENVARDRDTVGLGQPEDAFPRLRRRDDTVLDVQRIGLRRGESVLDLPARVELEHQRQTEVTLQERRHQPVHMVDERPVTDAELHISLRVTTVAVDRDLPVAPRDEQVVLHREAPHCAVVLLASHVLPVEHVAAATRRHIHGPTAGTGADLGAVPEPLRDLLHLASEAVGRRCIRESARPRTRVVTTVAEHQSVEKDRELALSQPPKRLGEMLVTGLVADVSAEPRPQRLVADLPVPGTVRGVVVSECDG